MLMNVKIATVNSYVSILLVLNVTYVLATLVTDYLIMDIHAMVMHVEHIIAIVIIIIIRILFFHADIDECNEEIDSCDQNCTNANGSYTCSCSTGYQLHANGYLCIGNASNNYSDDKTFCIIYSMSKLLHQ